MAAINIIAGMVVSLMTLRIMIAVRLDIFRIHTALIVLKLLVGAYAFEAMLSIVRKSSTSKEQRLNNSRILYWYCFTYYLFL